MPILDIQGTHDQVPLPEHGPVHGEAHGRSINQIFAEGNVFKRRSLLPALRVTVLSAGVCRVPGIQEILNKLSCEERAIEFGLEKCANYLR